MRKLCILILLCAVTARAQTITDKTAISYVVKTISEINVKLWNGAIAQKVTAYRNDSLSSVVPADSITTWYQTNKRREITDPNEGVFNRKGYEVFEPYPLNIKTDQTGMQFGFRANFDKESNTVSHHLTCLGPARLVVTESGIELGNVALFMFKIEDLNKVLSPEEVNIIRSLAMQQATLGDFTDSYVDDQMEPDLVGQIMAYKSQKKESYSLGCYSQMQQVLGYYQVDILGLAIEDLYKSNGAFYSDADLKTRYSESSSPFVAKYEVQVPDNETGDDDANDLAVSVSEQFDFSTIVEIKTIKTTTDVVLHFTATINTIKKEVYVSYNDLKLFLTAYDTAVLGGLVSR